MIAKTIQNINTVAAILFVVDRNDSKESQPRSIDRVLIENILKFFSLIISLIILNTLKKLNSKIAKVNNHILV